MPFHAHRDERGEGLNGIAVAERLAAALPSLARVPILMPASTVALPGARLKLSPLGPRPVNDALRERILLIDEAALDQPETVAAILHHVHAPLLGRWFDRSLRRALCTRRVATVAVVAISFTIINDAGALAPWARIALNYVVPWAVSTIGARASGPPA